MARMFRSLSRRDFRRWYIAALISNLGSWMQATAQNWVVLTELTDADAAAMATSMALQLAPQLALMPVAGLVADRVDRRLLLFGSQLAQGALALALGALLLTGEARLWQVFIIAAILGIVMALDQPVRQTLVSDLVPTADVGNAISLNLAAQHAARMFGPALAGLLIAAIGSGWVFVVNSISFLPLLATLFLLPRQPSATETGNGWRELTVGVRYIFRRTDLRLVMVMIFLLGIFGMNFPLFASTMAVDFGAGSVEFGLLTSIMASGSLLGALLSAAHERPRLRVIVLAAATMGTGALIAALMPDYWSFAFVTVAIGLSGVITFTTAQSYVQTTTPRAIRGRVIAVHLAVLAAGTPVGAPFVGWIANEYGARWALGSATLLCGLACGFAVLWYLRHREPDHERHLARTPHPAPEHGRRSSDV